MSVSVSNCYHLAATSPISTFLNNFLHIYYYTPLDSCTYYGQGARGVATLFPALLGNPLYVRKYGRGSNWRSQCALSVCMHVQTTHICKMWSACRSRSCLLKIQVDGISAVPGDTVGAKKVYVSLRRTVEKRSVPFPLYGQPFRGTLFVRSENGHEYGKSTVAKRKRNGSLWLNERPLSVRGRRRSVYDEKTASSRRRRSAMTYRTVPKKSSLLTRCWTAAVLSSLRICHSTISCLR